MKRFIALCAVSALWGGGVFALDVAPGGESLFLYGQPKFLAGAADAAGGPVFSAGSYSFNMNPALTAGLQCLSADLGYTGIVNTDSETLASAARLGLSVPNRFGVFSGALQGFFGEDAVGIGNVAVARAGFSRDVTENFYLGVSVSFGMLFYEDNQDFYAGADVGAWSRVPSIAFLKNVRFGLTVQNIGKSFDTAGPVKDFKVFSYPAMFTPKLGVAASFLDIKDLEAGFSLDAAFPTFANIVFNAGLQLQIKNIVVVSAGWDFNLREYVDGSAVHGPVVGVGVKIQLNTSGSELMSKRGFSQTDIDADLLWQDRGDGLQMISVGAAASFGVKDTIAPEIKIGEIRLR
ncbi:MAG: hypothetical protein LBC53_04820 [Spirochaetaceae bacterium]|nr:hypothetical protein [Spirochaetaceae bacterium]